MTPKLTEAQVKALRKFPDHGGEHYSIIGVRWDVMVRLCKAGMIEGGVLKRITPAGRAALAAIDGVKP